MSPPRLRPAARVDLGRRGATGGALPDAAGTGKRYPWRSGRCASVPAVKYVRDPFTDVVVDDPDLAWLGRPAVSHVVAEMVASGELTKRHRVLDIGCGRGTDLLALAAWGFRKLHGLDYNKAELRVAKARERRLLDRRAIEWKAGTLAALREYPPARFDLVLDVFLLSNLRRKHFARYFREVARVLKPGGKLLVHFKVGRGEPDGPQMPSPPRALFEKVRRYRTGMAEGEKGLAPPQLVMVYVLERRG